MINGNVNSSTNIVYFSSSIVTPVFIISSPVARNTTNALIAVTGSFSGSLFPMVTVTDVSQDFYSASYTNVATTVASSASISSPGLYHIPITGRNLYFSYSGSTGTASVSVQVYNG